MQQLPPVSVQPRLGAQSSLPDRYTLEMYRHRKKLIGRISYYLPIIQCAGAEVKKTLYKNHLSAYYGEIVCPAAIPVKGKGDLHVLITTTKLFLNYLLFECELNSSAADLNFRLIV